MKKPHGCLVVFIVAIAIIISYSSYSWYSNRPVKLYERWIGVEPGENIKDLEGVYKFHLTESVCTLEFKTGRSTVRDIVERKGMSFIEVDKHWSTKADNRQIKVNDSTSRTNTFSLASWLGGGPIPKDLEVYYVSHRGDNSELSNGWVLYYSPSSMEVYWTNCGT